MTHGHELKGGNVGGQGCAGWRGIKGGKWDSCNSIINKVHLKETWQSKCISRYIIAMRHLPFFSPHWKLLTSLQHKKKLDSADIG